MVLLGWCLKPLLSLVHTFQQTLYRLQYQNTKEAYNCKRTLSIYVFDENQTGTAGRSQNQVKCQLFREHHLLFARKITNLDAVLGVLYPLSANQRDPLDTPLCAIAPSSLIQFRDICPTFTVSLIISRPSNPNNSQYVGHQMTKYHPNCQICKSS